jgi:hypothetical protein
MKQRNLQPVQPDTYYFEADKHGCEFVVLLPDGREFRFAGVKTGPCREDLRNA